MGDVLAEAMVRESEELVLHSYRDTLGNWTIGWGHKLMEGQDWTGFTIDVNQAEDWLESDMAVAEGLAAGFPFYSELSDIRQAVLISMCFQMGSAPLRWPDFVAALQAKDYPAAAQAGLDSLWHRQTPARCEREMMMLKTGDWQMQT